MILSQKSITTTVSFILQVLEYPLIFGLLVITSLLLQVVLWLNKVRHVFV